MTSVCPVSCFSIPSGRMLTWDKAGEGPSILSSFMDKEEEKSCGDSWTDAVLLRSYRVTVERMLTLVL